MLLSLMLFYDDLLLFPWVQNGSDYQWEPVQKYQVLISPGVQFRIRFGQQFYADKYFLNGKLFWAIAYNEPSVLYLGVCPELLQGTRSLKVLWSNNVTVNMMIVKVFWHCQWETSQSHIKLINWRSHQTKRCQRALKLVYRSRCSGILTKPPCGVPFQELGTFSIKVNDWESGKSLDIFSTGMGRGAERK